MSITAGGWPWPAARLTTRPGGEQVEPPVAEVVLLDERQHLAHASDAAARSAVEVDLDVEVAGVGEHRAVLHAREVLGAAGRRGEPVTVTKTSPRAAASSARHHLEALHARLERAHRVDLADDDLRPGAAGARRRCRGRSQP